MTLICASIIVQAPDEALRQALLAAEHGADLLELRLDLCTGPEPVKALVANAPRPCIVTCRPTWEGGHSDLPDQARLALLEQIDQAAYVDVELATQQRHPQLVARLPQRKIISAHDFQGRPERLHNLLRDLHAAPGDVSKIAFNARSIRDCLEIFEILRHRPRPTIAIAMGEPGVISRILAGKFGGLLTFAAAAAGGTAPGQPGVAELAGLYRFRSIQPHTRVYGVVASPVKHSMSPAVHNAAFAQTCHDGVYLPLLVEGSYESFKAFMQTFLAEDALHLSGLSVTLPHKTHALRYLQEQNAQIEPLALSIGAVNTIVIDRSHSDLRLHGLNTDYAAILDSICAALSIAREQLAGKRVAVIGAGGTGRTAVAALAHYGATVVVYNRTRARADELAAEFNRRTGQVVAADISRLCASCCDVFLNTTSVGMYPDTDASVFDDAMPDLSAHTLVFDTVYNPMETRLLRQARQAGAQTLGGIEMFVRQAARQFEAWTAGPAPIDLMRRVVAQRLGG